MFREVHVYEIREVLRLWFRGESLRSIKRSSSAERKTVRRYVTAATEAGLDRDGGAGHNVVIMGLVGVGKTFMATALGHAAVRRRHSVHFERTDRLLKRLNASRLDNSHDAEMRKLLRVDLLVLDDFFLQPLDARDTADVYELIVERPRRSATVTTSNGKPIEWLGLMADALLPVPPSTGCSPQDKSLCSMRQLPVPPEARRR
jgi:DNA replication protein DnaC